MRCIQTCAQWNGVFGHAKGRRERTITKTGNISYQLNPTLAVPGYKEAVFVNGTGAYAHHTKGPCI